MDVHAMISVGGNLGRVLPQVDTGVRRKSLPSRTSTVPQESSRKISIALLTPWNQQCGNAEFAKRLTSGFGSFAAVEPIELENLIEHDTLDSRRKQERYITKLIKQVHASDADLVHIQ
ncbi:MAG: hypothetical protein ACR2NI_11975, partial [Pirellulales bacterium]